VIRRVPATPLVRIALTALLAATALAATALAARAQAQAQAPLRRPPATVSDERAAAREFAVAAERLRVELVAAEPSMEARGQAALRALDDPRCDRAEAAAEGSRRIDVMSARAILGTGRAYDPARAPLERFLAEIDRIRTADRVLRGGRAGWRSAVLYLRTIPSVADPCGALDGWRRARFAASAAPVDLEAVRRRGRSASEDKVARAARRMRRLGVSTTAATRYTAAGMFRGILLDLF
jgi:hypothetical protein